MRVKGDTQARRLGATAAPFALVVAITFGAVAVLSESATPAGAAPATASQDYGPYTCLNGFVWREAVPKDYVCVTPDVRTQTKQDNALAPSRRSPNGGPFGPDTCLQGYVWREAVTNDHVCVPPATREQARSDNALAASRRNELRTKVFASGSPSRYYVRTDRINAGKAWLGLYRSGTRARIRGWYLNVPLQKTIPGGLLNVRTPVPACSESANAYFRVRDLSSTRWSSRRYVCTTL